MHCSGERLPAQLVVRGKLCSAFVAATFQNVAALLGLHSLPETMYLGYVSFLGLECPFHICLLDRDYFFVTIVIII